MSQTLDAAREQKQKEQEQRIKDQSSFEGEDSPEQPIKRPRLDGTTTDGDAVSNTPDIEDKPFFKPRETESTYSVSETQLRSLWQNTAVVQALGDARLQRILIDIDSPRDPRARERALDDAVATNPDFAAFVNTVLQTIGVRDIEGNCTLT